MEKRSVYTYMLRRMTAGGIFLASFVALAQSAPTDVARISFVQGSAQLSAGQGSDFSQAVVNMPVVDGSRLQSGGDGQVEVEFGDGSVARLTPNSTLQIDHVGQDQVVLEQLSGLSYYELNTGDGHPPYDLQANGVDVQPTTNSILRISLDGGLEVAVITGAVRAGSNGAAPVDVAQNQSLRAGGDNNGAPFAVTQGFNSDSWDNWNQDRDQAIAQEAALQTPVRDDSAQPQSENWNDLDADGNWYPVEGSGNVWVPTGVSPGWDPYGAGYWGYYPTMGYTWISAYPWGWLPYHCGAWNYYGFGWGWSPGSGCGRVWSPVVIARSHPQGWSMPPRPPIGIRPLPGQRLVVVDRGAVATGPWGFHGERPRPTHVQQPLNFRGASIMPVQRQDVRAYGFQAAKGTSPGTRSVLSGAPAFQPTRQGYNGAYVRNGSTVGVPAPRPGFAAPPVRPQSQPAPTMQRPPEMQRPQERPNVGYPAIQNDRSNYVPRTPAPPVHYSAPPPRFEAPHYQAPPPPPPSAARPAPGGRR